MAATILIVDDEKDIRISLSGILEDEGYSVISAVDGDDALDAVKAELPDLVLLDIWMPGRDGLETLAMLKEQFPFLTVVMISGHGTIETAVKATKLGAFDFIEKPLSLEKVLITVANALRLKRLSQENSELKKTVCSQYELVGDSPIIAALRAKLIMVAQTEASVLITGKNGTGKSLLAGAIHYGGIYKDKPFVTLKCSAIAESLMEMELFGYEKGAFTGAVSQKKGKLETADGGTVFLDEICELSLSIQARLLRALQDGMLERVGGSRCIPFSVRFIASSSRDLLKEVSAGRFMQDLYYQLAIVTLSTSSLREHIMDLPKLVIHFINQFSKLEGIPIKQIHPDALIVMQDYSWHGNVRELKNYVERLLIMTAGNLISLEDLYDLGSHSGMTSSNSNSVTSFRSARECFEREFILKRLEENDWNISKTAELIDVERSNLHRKIKSYGIDVHK